MEIAIGIVLIVVAVFLVVAVLMQSGKSHNLSGTIAGGAETFFGKSKANTLDKTLSKVTTIVCSPLFSASQATCPMRCWCPRCTPSKKPTVAAASGKALGMLSLWMILMS